MNEYTSEVSDPTFFSSKIKLLSGDIITINNENSENIFFVLKNILENDYKINVEVNQIKLLKNNEDDDYFCLFIENMTIEITEDISIKVKDYTGRNFERYIIVLNNKIKFILYKRQIFSWEGKTRRLFWVDYYDCFVGSRTSKSDPKTFITSQIQDKEFTKLKDIFTTFRSRTLKKNMEKYDISEEFVIDKLSNFFAYKL
jgi:hypothetical protein